MDAEKIILIYEHRCNGRKLFGGVAICTVGDFYMTYSLHDDLRVVTKNIDPKATTIDILPSDLMYEPEKQVAAAKKAEGGEVKEEVPWKAFLGHELENHGFTELTIIVPEFVAKGGKEMSQK